MLAVVLAEAPEVLAHPLALPFSSAGEKDAGTLRSLCVFKVEGTRAPAHAQHCSKEKNDAGHLGGV